MAPASALVLDFGGVISRTLFETHHLTERALGLAEGTLTWRGPFDPDGDMLWQSMQGGRISERDYWLARTRETGDLLGETWTAMSTFVKRARGDDPQSILRPEAVRAIEMCADSGIRLAVLSNELDLFYGGGFSASLALFDRFEVIVDATYTGILKPDPEAYALCLDRLGLAPRSCVFVDDQARNIDGARAAGLRTIHFDVKQPAASFNRALDALGIEPMEPDHA